MMDLMTKRIKNEMNDQVVQVYQLGSWQQACSHLVISCEYLFQNIIIIDLSFSPHELLSMKKGICVCKGKIKMFWV